MTISTASLETALQQKLDALSVANASDEFVLLIKALEAFKAGTSSSVADISALPPANLNTGRLIHVLNPSSRIYYSTGVTWQSFATSEAPVYIKGVLASEAVDLIDYNLITDAVTVSLDYGLITVAHTAQTNLGALSILSPGINGDIYIDPVNYTFTLYDGVTRGGVKTARADLNNIDFYNMSASKRGFVHLLKGTNTTIPLGTPTIIPFSSAKLIDPRLGSFVNGTFVTNYRGWFKVDIQGICDGLLYVGFGADTTGLDSSTVIVSRATDFAGSALVYLEVGEALNVYGMSVGVVNRTIFGYDYNHPDLTRLSIEYLGLNN